MARKRFDVTSFRADGFRDLELALAELPRNIGIGAAKRAIKRAGEMMADAQRALAPVGKTAALRDKIIVDVSSRNLDGLRAYAKTLDNGGSRREADAALRSERRRAKKMGTQMGHRLAVVVGPAAPHAHLVEYGTRARKHKKTGKSTGAMPAQPYMRPAFDNNKDRAVQIIRDGLADEVEAAAKRMARRAARKARKAR